MPFAGYDDFQGCVRANSDKDDPEAYCAAIKREVEGEDALTAAEAALAEDPCEAGYTMVGTKTDANGNVVPNCVPDDDVPDANLRANARALAEFRNPGDIQRVDEGGGVRYKRVMLLSPGTWTDAGSEQTVDYTPDGIRASAENFVDIDAVQTAVPNWAHLSNDERARKLEQTETDISAEAIPLNLLHGPAMYGTDSLDEVGTIPTESIIVDDDGRLYGDLVMHGDSPQSETAIDLMDEVLEAAQDPGSETPPVGPSVEIPADRVDDDGGTLTLQEAWFSGVGVVFNPASRPVELGTQARNRAVAMTAATDDGEGVVFRAMQGEPAVHRPMFNGTQTGTPTETPDAEAFNDTDLETIGEHALASLSGFPPDDFSDVLGIVVDPDTGDLSLPLLRETAQSLAAADLGDEQAFMARLDAEQQREAWTTLLDLAEANFGDAIGPTLPDESDDVRMQSRALQAEDWSDVDTVPPEDVQANAQMALDAREETGDPNDCGTQDGWTTAGKLADGEAMTPQMVTEIAAFSRHEENKEQGEDGRADCGWMMWKAWGGDAGVKRWAPALIEAAENAAERANRSAKLKRVAQLQRAVRRLRQAR